MLEDPPTHHEDPRSPEAWSDFIARELSGTRKAYLAKPDFLLGHSRAERQTTADYAGRELLELVQNAADAAAEDDRLSIPRHLATCSTNMWPVIP